MPLVPINLAPGIWRNGTQYQAAGRWFDGNLIRWVQGVLQPIGGWVPRTSTQFTGTARGLLTWRSNSGQRRIAVGTNSKLYFVNETGTLVDITPTSGFTAGLETSTQNYGYGAYLYGSGTYGSFSAVGTGYGAYNYGFGSYGIARPDFGTSVAADTWSLDTWGEQLVGCLTSDGKILLWDGDPGTDAAAVENAPTGCVGLVVTADRILMALGAENNPRYIKWCDQENLTDWTPSDTNRAGFWNLQTQGVIACAKRVRGGTMILTNIDAHLATYVNFPLVYGFEQVGTACGILGPNAAATFDGYCMWMGRFGFHLFDGTVRKIECDVQDYIFQNINFAQKEKIYAFANSTNYEVWWLYPSLTSNECDRYVLYNWMDRTWAYGIIWRTAGADRGAYDYPIMAGSDGYLYDHEFGFDWDPLTPYAESGTFQLGAGDQAMHVMNLIPDERTTNSCEVIFKTSYYPNSPPTISSAYTLYPKTNLRLSGRQVIMKVQGASPNSWRWGTPRLEVVPGDSR